MKLIIVLLFVVLLCDHVSPQSEFVSSFCIEKSGIYTANSSYDNNLSLLFINLISASSSRGFYNSTAGEGSDKVYGLFYCRGDLKSEDCHNCVQTAQSRIREECSDNKEAIIFYDKCTFRYANRSIFSLEEENPNDWSYSETTVSDKDQFNQALVADMDVYIDRAAFNASLGGFAVGRTSLGANQTLYCLAQCTPDILGSPCQKCLAAALDNLVDEGKTTMSLFMPSCQVMYSLDTPFFNTGNVPISSPASPSSRVPSLSPPSQVPSGSPRKSKQHIVVGVVVSVATLGLILFLAGLWLYLRRRVPCQNFKGHPSQEIIHSRNSSWGSSSRLSYEELASATDNFSSTNLLGQGGFGYVHKGMLPNGKAIAVKQLKTGSAQGEREFKAEVETISSVHHRHLVSLVGYCTSGDQRMLVYEYIPNKTLEFHLHGEQRPTMSWKKRWKVALGAARGLAYLHEDCKPKIIHRDIKAANILLDNEFEAKVADFGLARFSLDTDTHVSTRVVGTFGYMAPDYAISGKLTEKSDVFSFGVVLLELITGRQPFGEDLDIMEAGLVHWARPLLMEALESRSFKSLVDPKLDKYDQSEMIQMVACASVCIRSSARQRPKMSQVVRALEGNLSAEELLKENASVSSSDTKTFLASAEDYDSSSTSQYHSSTFTSKQGLSSSASTTGKSTL